MNQIKEKQKFEAYFFDKYGKVKRFALSILKNEEDAEDITQDIFIKIWNQPEIWKTDEYSDSYIFTMTKNHIFNLLRRRLLENKYINNFQQETNQDFTTAFENELYSKELKLLFLMKIDQMPPQRKKIFKMSRIDKSSNQEIADKLELSIRTVERHIYLALGELKELLLIILFFINTLSS